MKTTRYLYNVEARDFMNMEYKDALEYKLHSAKDIYYKLLMAEEDYDRQFYIWKAMTHTRKLLEELEDN